MNQGWIYKYTFPNGKVYIGQTRVSVKSRHSQHMRASQNKKHKCLCEMAIAKYGEPKLEVIETVEDDKPTELVRRLNEAEKKWIGHYQSTDLSKGYNVKEGGERKTPMDMILQEVFQDIYTNEKWDDFLLGAESIILKIREKTLDTREELTEDENNLWNNFKIRTYDLWDDDASGETSFREIYERDREEARKYNEDNPDDIRQVMTEEEKAFWNSDEGRDILDPEFQVLLGEEDWWRDPDGAGCFDHAMMTAFRYLEGNIQKGIWDEIYSNPEAYIREWWNRK